MTEIISKRLNGVSESATLKLNAMVQTMKAQGVDVVNLTAGEPDFNVPDEAKKAVLDAISANKSKYTPAAGIPELREAVAQKTNLQQPHVAAVQPWKGADVVMTNGGKQALFDTFLALLDPGDEVLIPSPYWLSYPEMVKVAQGTPKILKTSFSQGFKITPEQLARAITPKTKILVLNSPSNPTGVMYSREEFKKLGEVLLRPEAERVWVISDEIYDRISFGEVEFASFLDCAPGLRERCVTVNGMSKSAAMTGWRIGWSVAPQRLTQSLITLQGQSTSNINALAQWASLAALKLPDSYFDANARNYLRRRNLALEILRKAHKIEVLTPAGAFYIFLGVREHFHSGEDSMGFAERLLGQAKVAVVPGTPFGEPGFVRLSFALDDRSLQEGCERIVGFLEGAAES
jgi:aspartate aminotransferase